MQYCWYLTQSNETDAMCMFIDILNDILHENVRFAQTKNLPLIPDTSFVLDNKFKNAFISLLQHYQVINSPKDLKQNTQNKARLIKLNFIKLLNQIKPFPYQHEATYMVSQTNEQAQQNKNYQNDTNVNANYIECKQHEQDECNNSQYKPKINDIGTNGPDKDINYANFHVGDGTHLQERSTRDNSPISPISPISMISINTEQKYNEPVTNRLNHITFEETSESNQYEQAKDEYHSNDDHDLVDVNMLNFNQDSKQIYFFDDMNMNQWINSYVDSNGTVITLPTICKDVESMDYN